MYQNFIYLNYQRWKPAVDSSLLMEPNLTNSILGLRMLTLGLVMMAD
jgi:hypothetical protein